MAFAPGADDHVYGQLYAMYLAELPYHGARIRETITMRIETNQLGQVIAKMDADELSALAAMVSQAYSNVVESNVLGLDRNTLRAAERVARGISTEEAMQRMRRKYQR